MRFDPPLVPGRLLRRYKRFLSDVELADGSVVVAHCPNPGRMTSCNAPGSPVLLSRAASPTRKLAYTLELVGVDGRWVAVNTMRPNAVVHEAIAAGRVAELTGYNLLRREVAYGRNSRVDLLLEGAAGRCYVEVKNVTLAADGVAYFPDAVTARGARHMDELAACVRSGDRAVLLYVVNHPGCHTVRPADAVDPVYGQALRRAAQAGVEVLAYGCAISPQSLELAGPIRVDLS